MGGGFYWIGVCSHGDGNLCAGERASGAGQGQKQTRRRGKEKKKLHVPRLEAPPTNERATPKREVDTRSRPESCLLLSLYQQRKRREEETPRKKKEGKKRKRERDIIVYHRGRVSEWRDP